MWSFTVQEAEIRRLKHLGKLVRHGAWVILRRWLGTLWGPWTPQNHATAGL